MDWTIVFPLLQVLVLTGALASPLPASARPAAPIIECNATTVNQPCDTDDTVCTVEKCVQIGASVECQFVANAQSGTACESDAKVCTKDTCAGAVCVHEMLPVGTVCYDGLFCTDGETCDSAGNCQGGLPTCDDQDACTTDTCDENLNTCSHGAPMTCAPDGNPCTSDACQPQSGCSYPPEPTTTPCDDGRFCSTNDRCDGAGSCTGALGCIDGNPCTDDSCDEATDTCANQTMAGQSCNDNNPCTSADACTPQGTCVGTTMGDGTPCSAAGGCVLGGSCQGGVCQGGAPAPMGTACDDGSACTTVDQCQAGQCRGKDRVCTDGMSCTLDGCDPAIGCVAEPVPGCADAGPPGADAGPGVDAALPGVDASQAFAGELAGGGCGCRLGSRRTLAPGRGLAAVGLGLIAFALMRRRMRRAPSRRPSRRARAFITLGVVALALTALGRGPRARAQVLDAQIFTPTPSSTGFFSQDGPTTLPPRTLNLGLTIDVAGDPLLVRDPSSGAEVQGGAVLARRTGAVFTAAFGLTPRLELGLSLPTVVTQEGDLGLVRPGDGLAGTVLGDVRLSAKLALPRLGPLALAARVGVSLPTGDGAAFAGDDGMVVTPALVVGAESGRVRVGVDLGYAVRGESTTMALSLGDEVRAGAGVAVNVMPARLWLVGETYLRYGVEGRGRGQERPVEVVAGVRLAAFGPWQLQAGGGAGLSHGYGAPAWRGFLGLAYAPHRAAREILAPDPLPDPVPDPPITKVSPTVEKDLDQDDDGILDDDDDCPALAEDKDDFEDDDGCPDLDHDHDGIVDTDDKCPTVAEVVNGVDDGDGCPDEGLFEVKEDRIVLEERVLFDTDRARVRHRGKKVLAAVVTLWGQHPEWDHIVIEGHTDERGSDGYNQELGQRRAERVRDALVAEGFPKDKIEIVSYGRTRPRATGSSEEAWEKNRRVEFVIVRKTRQPVPRVTP